MEELAFIWYIHKPLKCSSEKVNKFFRCKEYNLKGCLVFKAICDFKKLISSCSEQKLLLSDFSCNIFLVVPCITNKN